ncbi:MAG: hypothetical protein ACRCRP_00500 [Metamycoplasmataceae bacterium]
MHKKLLPSFISLITIVTVPALIITSCSSETPTTKNLIITAKPNPKLTEADITTLKGTELPTQLIVLQKLFDNQDLNSTNQDKFTISVDENNKIVTLTAKSGYTINGQSKLDSNKYEIELPVPTTDLTITIKTNVKLTNTEVTTLEGSNSSAKWTVLEKLFQGKDFLSGNIDNKFTITFSKSNLEVTLTAKSGYTISGKPTLSNKFTVDGPITSTNLAITAKSGTITLTETEVANLEGTDNNNKLIALQKLFQGNDLKIENFDNFTISVNKTTQIVTLTAKTNFTINNQNKLDSNRYTLQKNPITTDLKITANSPQFLTQQEDIDIKGTNAAKQLPILQKLFKGVSSTNQNNFKVTVSANNAVILTANQGYSFNGQQSLSSPIYTIETAPPVDKNLAITAKKAPVIESSDIADLQGTNNSAKFNALQKLFQGNDLTTSNLTNFNVAINIQTRIITLTANSGFTFNGGKSLVSYAYNINLNITAKKSEVRIIPGDVLNLDWDNNGAKLAALEKIFEGTGLISSNLDKFNIEIIRITYNTNITLTAKPGYIFSNTPTLTKFCYVDGKVNANITAVSGPVSLSVVEENILKEPSTSLNRINQLAVLRKLFIGIFDTNQRFFQIEIKTSTNASDRIVTLKAKPGFVIGATPDSSVTTISKKFI